MAKFGGFGGGMGNMQQLMKQAQKMQQDMLVAKEILADTEVIGKAGGDMVQIKMTCNKKLISINIKPEAVDCDDIEMLEDLLMAAFNDAQAQADKLTEDKMGPLGGLGI